MVYTSIYQPKALWIAVKSCRNSLSTGQTKKGAPVSGGPLYVVANSNNNRLVLVLVQLVRPFRLYVDVLGLFCGEFSDHAAKPFHHITGHFFI